MREDWKVKVQKIYKHSTNLFKLILFNKSHLWRTYCLVIWYQISSSQPLQGLITILKQQQTYSSMKIIKKLPILRIYIWSCTSPIRKNKNKGRNNRNSRQKLQPSKLPITSILINLLKCLSSTCKHLSLNNQIQNKQEI